MELINNLTELNLLLADMQFLIKGLNAISDSMSEKETVQDVKNDNVNFCRLAEIKANEMETILRACEKQAMSCK